MLWEMDFIREEDFREHVKKTIEEYKDSLASVDLASFNRNIVDPIKLTFDKAVFGATWKEIVSNEIFRQRDKKNNNSIGYFHQKLFRYIDKCKVPNEGWDVVFSNPDGIKIGADTVKTVYVEMKNKHNTMNSASAAKTYIKMQNQLLADDSCACFLVEAIAKHSQDIKWDVTVDGKRLCHNRIRRVSIDCFYSIVTGDSTAFFKICMALPGVIRDVVEKEGAAFKPHDTVYEELLNFSKQFDMRDENLAFTLAVYMLGFNAYLGFAPENV